MATGAAGASSTTSSPAQPGTELFLKMAHPYKPHEAPGSTDDYHCTLMNPHIKKNSYIISSEFLPGSDEVHHAALYPGPTVTGPHRRAGQRSRKGLVLLRRGSVAEHGHRRPGRGPVAQLLGSGPRGGRSAQGDGGPSAGRKPGHHAGPLQPSRRRQAGEQLADPPHGAQFDAAPSPPSRSDAGPAQHSLSGRCERPAVYPHRGARQRRQALRPGGGRRGERDRRALRGQPFRPSRGDFATCSRRSPRAATSSGCRPTCICWAWP